MDKSNYEVNGRKQSEERMKGAQGSKSERKEAKSFSPGLEKLCDDYLKQGVLFAKKFVELAGLPEDTAPDVEHKIVGDCSLVISRARISATGVPIR